MTPLERAYADLVACARGLDETGSWQPTRCAGWAVRDLLFHLLGDAQRALVALATPADGPADRDAVSYWTTAPGAPDPDSRNLRAVRTMASAWRLEHLVETYAETTAAVTTLAARTDPAALVATQGHVLTTGDLVATLVVEAAVHHLDLPSGLPAPGPLAVVRTTLDGLLGRPAPGALDDVAWALLGTGRSSVGAALLGRDAARLPLLR